MYRFERDDDGREWLKHHAFVLMEVVAHDYPMWFILDKPLPVSHTYTYREKEVRVIKTLLPHQHESAKDIASLGVFDAVEWHELQEDMSGEDFVRLCQDLDLKLPTTTYHTEL